MSGLISIIFLDLTNIIIIMSNNDFAWHLETDACLRCIIQLLTFLLLREKLTNIYCCTDSEDPDQLASSEAS